ncbi:MAG TPA: hypothetical protein VK973_16770, partial [Arenicellales bacterium]|nr:hypothetical protein [Arenicellales bacterium]
RRGFIAEKYKAIIDALYGGKTSCYVEVQVTYEDGRTGVLAGDLEIRDVSTVSDKAPLKKAS